MKNAKQFLIISVIVHLLVFIVLAFIVLPPVDRFKEFLSSLSVDIVTVEPVVRKQPSPRTETKPEQKSEAAQELKPPELEAFSASLEKPITSPARVASSGKVTELKTTSKSPEKKGMVSVQPLTLKPMFRSTDDKKVTAAPGSYEDEVDVISSRGTGEYSGSRVGPIGSRASAKGQSEQYLYQSGTPQALRGPAEFAEILPILARGILKRTTGEKIDIIFLIDTTGSMRDNVSGIKDHIERFLQPIEENKIDAALGLVEFGDQEVREPRVLGLTRSQKKFTKWLDRTRFFGGRDIAESGYEALIAALEKIDFRDDVQRAFIFISDAPQHDFDYDGKSRYTLDRMIARLNDEGVVVDVVGVKYLSMKQLAWGTGGQWRHIPGGDPLMDIPQPTSSMIRSRLGRSLPPGLLEDKVTIQFNDPVPDWVDLSYKMLDPRGLKCLGTLTYRIKVRQKETKQVEFAPTLDLRKFGDQPGTYTLIYRIRDSVGNRDILRRTLELQRANS